MNREETNAAIRLSLLLADTRATRHGVYARRPAPAIKPPVPPPGVSIHHTIVPDVRDDTGFADGAHW